MNEILKLFLEYYGTITLIVTSVLSFIIFLRKKIRNAINAINTITNFHSLFGENPAHAIKSNYESVKQSTDILSIRQEIHEKYLQIGIYISECTDGRTLWTNEYLNDLFGLDSQEMLDFGWLRAVKFNERNNIYKIFSECVKNKTPLQCIYTIYNEKTKKEHVVETEAFPVLNNNTITCYVGLVIIRKEQENEDTKETKKKKAFKSIDETESCKKQEKQQEKIQ
jgi:hypothetical protein